MGFKRQRGLLYSHFSNNYLVWHTKVGFSHQCTMYHHGYRLKTINDIKQQQCVNLSTKFHLNLCETKPMFKHVFDREKCLPFQKVVIKWVALHYQSLEKGKNQNVKVKWSFGNTCTCNAGNVNINLQSISEKYWPSLS